ncbi:hypothetical protein NDU88_000520 [Pleurodeles waltl]|uniref:Uncharacterized protein n=1 Tax=Pleurodeles waltl TaxID=8319 RepID=A0AAV7TFZ4_PLEWA|nr:hypothetical protein NDU88_000520 [Pleurodeles waltl]
MKRRSCDVSTSSLYLPAMRSSVRLHGPASLWRSPRAPFRVLPEDIQNSSGAQHSQGAAHVSLSLLGHEPKSEGPVAPQVVPPPVWLLLVPNSSLRQHRALLQVPPSLAIAGG